MRGSVWRAPRVTRPDPRRPPVRAYRAPRLRAPPRPGPRTTGRSPSAHVAGGGAKRREPARFVDGHEVGVEVRRALLDAACRLRGRPQEPGEPACHRPREAALLQLYEQETEEGGQPEQARERDRRGDMPAEATEQRHDAEDDEQALRQDEASPARDDRRSGGRAADAVGTQEEDLHRLAAHPRGGDAVHRLAGQPLEPETGERLGDTEGPENDAPAEGVAERYDRVRQQRERQDRTESDEAPPDLLGTALVDEPGEQEDAGEGGKDGHRAPSAPRRPRAPLRRGPLGGPLRCTHCSWLRKNALRDERSPRATGRAVTGPCSQGASRMPACLEAELGPGRRPGHDGFWARTSC